MDGDGRRVDQGDQREGPPEPRPGAPPSVPIALVPGFVAIAKGPGDQPSGRGDEAEDEQGVGVGCGGEVAEREGRQHDVIQEQDAREQDAECRDGAIEEIGDDVQARPEPPRPPPGIGGRWVWVAFGHDRGPVGDETDQEDRREEGEDAMHQPFADPREVRPVDLGEDGLIRALARGREGRGRWTWTGKTRFSSGGTCWGGTGACGACWAWARSASAGVASGRSQRTSTLPSGWTVCGRAAASDGTKASTVAPGPVSPTPCTTRTADFEAMA